MTMFGTEQCGVKAHIKAGVETGVGSARLQQLIGMPFHGAAAGIRAPRGPSLKAPRP
jgi:hypothetical protein